MTSTITWIGFNIFLASLIGLDLYLSSGHIVNTKKAISRSLFWIFLAFLFAAGLNYVVSDTAALEFLSGYLIELSLSVDNLFVFIMAFQCFHIPQSQQSKVLFFGILGALVMRILFIFAGISLIQTFSWIFPLFGVFLCITGILLYNKEEKKYDPSNNVILRLIQKFIPLDKENHDGHFFVRKKGKTFATPLFAVLVVIETLDLVFALDSIPAVFGVTLNPFIVYASNAFAILGLRSLYFSLQHVMQLFHYIHHAVCIILIFVGLKMVLHSAFPITTLVSLLFILFTLGSAILASLLHTKPPKKEEGK
jgi:tellurite resistance protein TerC